MAETHSRLVELLIRIRFPLLLTVAGMAALVGLAIMAPRGPDDALVVSGPMSLLPPLAAILAAIVWRRVIPALAFGVLAGAVMVQGGNPATGLVTAASFVGGAAVSVDNLYMFAFTLSLMGMVGVILRNGGVDGAVALIARFAKGRRSTQGVVAGMGAAVFFDDYANAVVVGTSSRPLTDRARISREKLAYIVDSTAAPIASLAIVSTWIGIEIRYLDEQIGFLGQFANTGYGVFLQLIPYRFYCIFALMGVAIIAWSGRDFGPMLKAERRAWHQGQPARPDARIPTTKAFQRLRPKEGVAPRALFGLMPILVTLTMIFVLFFLQGSAILGADQVSPFSLTSWRDCFCAVPNSTQLLMYSGMTGSLTALVLSIASFRLSVVEALGAWLVGARSVVPALALLILAIALRKATDGDHLKTAEYVVALLTDVSPYAIPVAVFFTAVFISFSTGTSWGTMGILLPVAVPAAFYASQTANDPLILLITAGAVLDGAVFGDHCSPISDTTLLSSIGSWCDLMDHVKTQLPYALMAMTAAALGGYVLLLTTSIPLWSLYLGGFLAMALFVRLVGRHPNA